MKTITEVSRLTGLSVRTLHYYDSIGLLSPTAVTDAGYRLYGDEALGRLRDILFFRELGFPLKEIGRILDSPDYDPADALEKQIHLLELQRERIDRMLALARQTLRSGGNTMDFSAFDKTELDACAAEAKERWGNTEAYRESAEKAKKTDPKAAGEQLMALFGDMGKLKDLPPDGEEAQEAVKELQQFITDSFYNCTKEILAGLGQMYTGDERFRKNIDSRGGEGTAAFVSRAIAVYCK